MVIVSNTLAVELDTWDDPGDYPSGAGSGPLPSYRFVAGCSGDVVLELTDEEVEWYHEDARDFLGELTVELPYGVRRVVWGHRLEGRTLTLDAQDIEADPNWEDSDERDE